MSASPGDAVTKRIRLLPPEFVLICITIAVYNKQIYDHVGHFLSMNSVKVKMSQGWKKRELNLKINLERQRDVVQDRTCGCGLLFC